MYSFPTAAMVAHTRLNVALYVHCLSYYYITQEHGYPSFGGRDALLLQSLSILPIFSQRTTWPSDHSVH